MSESKLLSSVLSGLSGLSDLSDLAGLRGRFSDRGASLVEYSLLIALIAVVVIASVALFGGSVNENFSVIASEVNG